MEDQLSEVCRNLKRDELDYSSPFLQKDFKTEIKLEYVDNDYINQESNVKIQGALDCDFDQCKEETFKIKQEVKQETNHVIYSSSVDTQEQKVFFTFNCLYPGCHRMFSRKRDMNVHVRIHEGFTEFMPYQCPVKSCGQKFRTTIMFGKHLAEHNSNSKYKIKDRGMNFHGYEELRVHEALQSANLNGTENYILNIDDGSQDLENGSGISDERKTKKSSKPICFLCLPLLISRMSENVQ